MSNVLGQVTTLELAKRQQLYQRVQKLKSESLLLFNSLVAVGTLTCRENRELLWDDVVWVYRSRKLWFCQLRGLKDQVLSGRDFVNPENIKALNGEMEILLKCFIVHLLRKNPNYTATHLSRCIQPMRWIFEYVAGDFELFLQFDQIKLERLFEYIESQGIYNTKNSFFMICRDITTIFNWFSRKHLLIKLTIFKNTSKDPRIERMDVTTKAFEEHRAKKFPDNKFIDAVTSVKRKLTNNPALEPKPGYDWIRIHTIPFMLALGLRIGEVLTLPLNALYEDDASGKLFVRVWTEKGQPPTLRYVPKIWAPAIRESYQALLELCHDARELAKEIEVGDGFSFIQKRLNEIDRAQKDLDRLAECGFDSNEYYYTRELSIIGFKSINFMPQKGGIIRELVEDTGYSGKKWQKVVSIKRLLQWFEDRFNNYLSSHYQANILQNELNNTVKVEQTLTSSFFSQEQPLYKHLIVVFEQQFNGYKKSITLLPRPMTQDHIYSYYTSKSQGGSVFKRLDIRDSKDKEFRLTAHQFRHWTTTSLQREGSNDMAIDLWMGRQIGQNREYDNRTGKERAEAIREKYLQREGIPDDYLGRKVRLMRLHEYDEAIVASTVNEFITVAHITPWGFCSRDLAVIPCTRSLQCLKGFESDNPCRHFHIDSADMQAKENIKRLFVQYEHQLQILVPEYDNDDFKKELNLDETVDQHIYHAMQIVSGCKAALRSFELSDGDSLISVKQIRQLNADKVFEP